MGDKLAAGEHARIKAQAQSSGQTKVKVLPCSKMSSQSAFELCREVFSKTKPLLIGLVIFDLLVGAPIYLHCKSKLKIANNEGEAWGFFMRGDFGMIQPIWIRRLAYVVRTLVYLGTGILIVISGWGVIGLCLKILEPYAKRMKVFEARHNKNLYALGTFTVAATNNPKSRNELSISLTN